MPENDPAAFVSRVSRLQGDLEAVHSRLWAQHDVLLRLRNDAAGLKDQYRSLHERAAAALEALKAAPVPEAALRPETPDAEQPVPAEASKLSPKLPRGSSVDNFGTLSGTRFYDDGPAPSARRWLPYGALALAGAAMMFGMPRLYARRADRPLPEPAPEALRAVLPIDFSSSSVPPPAPIDAVAGRGDADAALKLVYAFVPLGSRRSIGELAGAASSSIVEPSGDGRFLVTLRPTGSASGPVYEFEVDPARGSVQPSQETQADLEGAWRLASRG